MEEKGTSKSNALRLPGAAPKGVYSFRDHRGNLHEDGMHTIFPIVKQVEGGDIQLIGTGFFIAGNGVFATAKHVLFDVLDDNGQQTFPIGIFHFFPDDQFIIRPVLRCSHNTIADVAIGVAAPATHNETGEFLSNPTLILTTEVPAVGDLVTTYAYPNTKIERVGTKQVLNFIPDFYEGRLEEMHLEGRDASMLPGPCYRTSIFMHGGASGGPVVDQRGRVFGINSTGFHGMDVSYVSRINELFPLSLDVEESGTVRTLSIPEIANRGWITFDPLLDES
jgi:hypothetical protein